MDAMDLMPKSSFVNFRVEHDEISQTPKYRTDVVTVPTSMKNQYESLEKRNRYLGIGLLVVLLAMCAMTAFVVKEKLDHDGEKRNSVGNHQVSFDELRAEFNSKMKTLQTKISNEADTRKKNEDTMNQSVDKVKNALEMKITDEQKNVHNIMNNLSKQVQSTVNSTDKIWENLNDTVARIRLDIMTQVEQTANATSTRVDLTMKLLISDLGSRLNRTETLLNNVIEMDKQKVNVSSDMEALVLKSVNQSMNVMGTSLRTKITSDLKGMNNRIDNLSKQIQSTVNSTDTKWKNLNATVTRIRPEVLAAVEKTANATYIRMEQVSNKSISEMKSLLNQTKSLVDEITQTESPKDHNKNAKTTAAPSDQDGQFGSVFRFNFSDVHKDEDGFYRFHDKLTRVISGVPVELSILISGGERFEANVFFGCIKSDQVQFKWPLRKAIQFVILSEKNKVVRKHIYRPEDEPSCQDPVKFNWEDGTLVSAKLPDEVRISVIAYKSIRVGIKLMH